MGTEVEDRTLVALTPEGLPAAQAGLADWCTQKMAAIGVEIADLEANVEIGMRNLWRVGALQRAVTKAKQQLTYYEKIRAAVNAGYLIIPNFPVDVFAVRVGRVRPVKKTSTYASNITEASPDLLPAGEGRYVDDETDYDNLSHVVTEDGKEKRVARFTTTEYKDWDFPFVAVKPQVLAALEIAMRHNIFDVVGTVEQRKADPIIVGRVLHPQRRYGQHDRFVTFFVAWWLSTKDL